MWLLPSVKEEELALPVLLSVTEVSFKAVAGGVGDSAEAMRQPVFIHWTCTHTQSIQSTSAQCTSLPPPAADLRAGSEWTLQPVRHCNHWHSQVWTLGANLVSRTSKVCIDLCVCTTFLHLIAETFFYFNTCLKYLFIFLYFYIFVLRRQWIKVQL